MTDVQPESRPQSRFVFVFDAKFAIVVGIIALAFGILVWPTIYRYDLLVSGETTAPVKINRLTGRTAIFVGSKWVFKDPPVTRVSEPLPATVLAQLAGNAGFGPLAGSFSGNIYNGSTWTVTELQLRVVAKEPSGDVRWDRRFAAKPLYPLTPLTTQFVRVSITGEQGTTAEWQIESAKGYPSDSGE